MEIEKTLELPAVPDRVWKILLDPQAMAACVPGMESVEVLSETEYLAVMKVKISFISAKFKLKTRIVEMDAPRYLRAEGTGEDTSVASSLKQVSEMWIRALDETRSELRIKVTVDLLGRMGTFGLSVMKTKADRLWEEFGRNLAARLQPQGAAGSAHPPAAGASASATQSQQAPRAETPNAPATTPGGDGATRVELPARPRGWVAALLARLRAPAAVGGGECIRMHYQNGGATIAMEWPVAASADCRLLVLALAQGNPPVVSLEGSR